MDRRIFLEFLPLDAIPCIPGWRAAFTPRSPRPTQSHVVPKTRSAQSRPDDRSLFRCVAKRLSRQHRSLAATCRLSSLATSTAPRSPFTTHTILQPVHLFKPSHAPQNPPRERFNRNIPELLMPKHPTCRLIIMREHLFGGSYAISYQPSATRLPSANRQPPTANSFCRTNELISRSAHAQFVLAETRIARVPDVQERTPAARMNRGGLWLQLRRGEPPPAPPSQGGETGATLPRFLPRPLRRARPRSRRFRLRRRRFHPPAPPSFAAWPLGRRRGRRPWECERGCRPSRRRRG